MFRLAIQFIFLVMLLFMSGCASHRIPIQTNNHPASSHAEVSQIELSPLLDISQNIPIEKQESDVHPHH